jgi:Rrf2 family protein
VQITRKTDYAIRCVLYLTHNKGKVSAVDKIAKEMCVPKTFLAKILQDLVKAKIIKSRRGIKGGFELAKSPQDISLYDVVTAIEGRVVVNKCAVQKSLCNLSSICSVHPIWAEIRKHLESVLKEKNFASL